MFHERPQAWAFKLGSQSAQQRCSCEWEGCLLLAIWPTKHPRLEQKPYTDRLCHEFSVCYAGIRFSYQHTTQKCHELINSQTTLALACHPVPLPQMLEGAKSAMLLFALSGNKVDFPKTVGGIKVIMVFLRNYSISAKSRVWVPLGSPGISDIIMRGYAKRDFTCQICLFLLGSCSFLCVIHVKEILAAPTP